MRRCGQLGHLQPADAEVQSLCDQMREQVERESGLCFSTFDALEYKTQCVAGTNYFVKVHLGNEQCVHLRIYQPLPCMDEEMSLTAFQTGKARQDEIKHFEPSD